MEKKNVLRIAAGVAAVLIAIYTFSVLTDGTRGFDKVETSIALEQLSKSNAKEVQINDREQEVLIKLKKPIALDGKDGIEQIITSYPARTADNIFAAVQKAKPEKFDTHVTQDSIFGALLMTVLPLLLVFGLIWFLMSRVSNSSMGGPFSMGKSRHKELNKDNPENTFDDVAGADEAVEELDEIRDFLSNPERYEKLGAKVPRGVLLYGPPGTGKTLLARAVAGEAGVPFYSISGSDFVEMFVGVGASRVRDLFKQAKENSPCIIFVDEIDAVGRQRGSGTGGGHDEREQTLNQLLVEMDGFGDREGVILMAATNRPDILDPALLRPGRFDRQIPVTNPDMTGREQILRVHAKGKPLADDVDLKSLAKRTAGMSGADLENVLNEAALLTARVDGNVITGDALEEATDRVIGGPRRTSKIISEQEKKITAYHEGGHTLAAWALKDIDRVYKVTILARGRTGGHAMTAPEDDKGMYNRSELFARLVFAMGGRAAEELVFGNPTTGASADIEMATNTARSMVMEMGMSPRIGAVKYGIDGGDPMRAYTGGGGESRPSPEVAALIDNEVRMLMDKAQAMAYEILRDNREYLDTLAQKLLEKETLRRPDLEAIFDGIQIREISDVFPGQDVDRPRDYREPVKTPNELAKERGEEPPKRNDIFTQARKARMARRKAEQERKLQEEQAQRGGQGAQGVQGQAGQPVPGQPIQHPQPGQPGQIDRPINPYGQHNQPNVPAQQSHLTQPRHGGQQPQPPLGSAQPPAGARPAHPGQAGYPPQPGQQGLPAQPGQGSHSGQQGHPAQPGPDHLWGGMPGEGSHATPFQAGTFDAPATDGSASGTAADQPGFAHRAKPEEQRGFRLPDHEQPDNPWTTDDAPTRVIPQVPPQQSFPWEKPRSEDRPDSRSAAQPHADEHRSGDAPQGGRHGVEKNDTDPTDGGNENRR